MAAASEATTAVESGGDWALLWERSSAVGLGLDLAGPSARGLAVASEVVTVVAMEPRTAAASAAASAPLSVAGLVVDLAGGSEQATD